MKVVTYNLRFGGSGKSHWEKIFDAFDPDVFLAQESFAPEEHLPPLIHGNRHRHACWKPVAGLKWGSAVYTKNGAGRVLDLPDFHGHVIGVEINRGWFAVEDRPVRIFSVHAPDRGGYQRAVHSILDMIGQHRGASDLIIGGDFNLTVGERHDTEILKTSSADLAILLRLRDEFGLVSAWQAANPGASLPQTLRWVKDRATPYHCDGIFIPRHWISRLRSAAIVVGPDWDVLSDHNPVVVELDADQPLTAMD